MAAFTLQSVADLFAVGSTVGAYAAGPVSGQPPVSGPRLASAIVASNGSLTFRGLATNTRYVAYDGTRDRSFTTDEGGGLIDVQVVKDGDTLVSVTSGDTVMDSFEYDGEDIVGFAVDGQAYEISEEGISAA